MLKKARYFAKSHVREKKAVCGSLLETRKRKGSIGVLRNRRNFTK